MTLLPDFYWALGGIVLGVLTWMYWMILNA